MEFNPFSKFIVNNPAWNFFLNKFFLPRVLKFVSQEPEKALEIGCGVGATTKALATYFPNMMLVAIDYDPSQLRIAKRNLSKIKNIKILQADVTKLPFKEQTFDTIFCFNTLHHIQDFKEALKEISRVLKSQGLFCIMEPTREFFNPIFKWIDRPAVLFSQKDIIDTASECKLKCQKLQGRKVLYSIFKKIEI